MSEGRLGRFRETHHNRDDFGVEPICTVLQVAPGVYYAAKTRPASARAQRDAVSGPAIVELWHKNSQVYGALATLSWVHWHNTQRLHGHLGDVPPDEYELSFYARARTNQSLVGIQ